MMTHRGDFTFNRQDVERITEKYGKRALMMGTLNQDGSLSVPMECYREAAHLLQSATGTYTSRTTATHFDVDPMVGFIDAVVEARKRKISDLTEAVQNAPTDAEARQYWRELEHVLFGV
jgi:hypothetical protein